MTPFEVIKNYQGGLNAFLDPSKRIKGISTGFTKLDEMTGGLHSGELIILAARPSMGKTAFALNIAWHVATRLLQPVAVFSLEMSQESLLTRMLCAAARVDSQRFRTGYLNEKERQSLRAAANQMVEAPIFIDDTAGANLMDMHSKLRKLKQTGQKLGLVVVDYLQLMSAKGRSENRNQEISQISRGLKLLSKELDCPFLVLSQLSRATETRQGDHRPQLSDLRESGAIEQDADLVGFIFREEVYKRDREDLHGVAELILAKQRNGPIGKVDLVFLHAQTRFENRAEDLGDLPPE
jgi:replicative DNA helicase